MKLKVGIGVKVEAESHRAVASDRRHRGGGE